MTIPERSLGDAQVNAEYVAYNIQDLAAKSSTGKVYVIGHSQGVSIAVFKCLIKQSSSRYLSART